MLTTIFLTAIALLQDPAFTWSEQTDHDYWQAVHLLEVEGEAGRAAELFLELAERDEVAATPGQAAFVRAWAALALVGGHRQAEADRLLANVRQGAIGTPFEVSVTDLLDRAAAAPQDPAGLDPDFLKLLTEQLAADFGENWEDLSRYGRRLLPYSLRILEEGLSGPEDFVLAQRMMQVSLPSGDDAFFAGLRERIRDLPGPQLRNLLQQGVLRFQAQESGAAEALDRFLVELSKDPDVSRARLGAEWLADSEADRGTDFTRSRLRDILMSPDDLLAPFVVNHLEFDSKAMTRLAFDAAMSPQEVVSRYARQMVFKAKDEDTYAQIAARGDVFDRRRLAWLLVPAGHGGWEWEASSGMTYRHGSPSRVAEELVADSRDAFGIPGYRLRRNDPRQDPGRWHDSLAPLIEDEDSLVRQLATIATVGQNDWVLTERILRSQDPELAFLAARTLDPRNYPASLDLVLLGLIGEGDLGEFCAKLSHDNVDRFDYESAVMADSLGIDTGSSLRQRLDGWAREGEVGLVLRWMRDPERSMDSRKAAAFALIDYAPLSAIPVFGFLRDADLSPRVRRDFRSKLTGGWSEQIGKQALQRGFLEPEEVEAWIFLGADSARHEGTDGGGYLGNWGILLTRMMAKEVRGALEIYLTLAENEETRSWLAKKTSPPASPPPVVLAVTQALITRDLGRYERDDVERYLFKSKEPETSLAVAYAILERTDDFELVKRALSFLGSRDARDPDREEILAGYLGKPAHAATVARLLVKAPTREDHVPAMLEAWELEGIENRATLIEALGNTLDDRVVPVLLEALADRNLEVAQAASRGLQRLRNVREEREAWEAWKRFGIGGSPTAALLDKLSSDNQEVRLAAIASLGTLKATEALPFLIELLEDEDPSVAEAARKALAKINAD